MTEVKDQMFLTWWKASWHHTQTKWVSFTKRWNTFKIYLPQNIINKHSYFQCVFNLTKNNKQNITHNIHVMYTKSYFFLSPTWPVLVSVFSSVALTAARWMRFREMGWFYAAFPLHHAQCRSCRMLCTSPCIRFEHSRSTVVLNLQRHRETQPLQ